MSLPEICPHCYEPCEHAALAERDCPDFELRRKNDPVRAAHKDCPGVCADCYDRAFEAIGAEGQQRRQEHEDAAVDAWIDNMRELRWEREHS